MADFDYPAPQPTTEELEAQIAEATKHEHGDAE